MANININNRKLITFTPQIIEDYARGKCNFAFGGGKVTLKYKVTSPTPVDEDFTLSFTTTRPGAILDIQVSGGTINGDTTLHREFRKWGPADLSGKQGESDLYSDMSERIRVKFDSDLTIVATVKPELHTTYIWDANEDKYQVIEFDCTKCVSGSGDVEKEWVIRANFLNEVIEYNAVGCHNKLL